MSLTKIITTPILRPKGRTCLYNHAQLNRLAKILVTSFNRRYRVTDRLKDLNDHRHLHGESNSYGHKLLLNAFLYTKFKNIFLTRHSLHLSSCFLQSRSRCQLYQL